MFAHMQNFYSVAWQKHIGRLVCMYVQLYAKQLSTDNEWPEPRQGSAVVWREPMAFGGRRMLIGDGNDFQEMISTYYGVTSHLSSCDVVKVTEDNNRIKIQVWSGFYIVWVYLRIPVVSYIDFFRTYKIFMHAWRFQIHTEKLIIVYLFSPNPIDPSIQILNPTQPIVGCINLSIALR